MLMLFISVYGADFAASSSSSIALYSSCTLIFSESWWHGFVVRGSARTWWRVWTRKEEGRGTLERAVVGCWSGLGAGGLGRGPDGGEWGRVRVVSGESGIWGWLPCSRLPLPPWARGGASVPVASGQWPVAVWHSGVSGQWSVVSGAPVRRVTPCVGV
eukprot:scaffold7549_cov111-Isochrysis_galbana.AAC.8